MPDYGYIFEALKNDDLDTVKQILMSGLDVNVTHDNGSTLLHFAAYKGQKDIVELLITKGAKVNARNRDNVSPLPYAVREGHTDIAAMLIINGADTNERAKDGSTLLHLAAFRGYKDLAEILIEHGADANVKNQDGFTALQIAQVKGHNDIAAFLAPHTAAVEAPVVEKVKDPVVQEAAFSEEDIARAEAQYEESLKEITDEELEKQAEEEPAGADFEGMEVPARKLKAAAPAKKSNLPAMIFVLAIVIGLGVALYYIVLEPFIKEKTAHNTVRFAVTPADAEVYIDDKKASPLPRKDGLLEIKDLLTGKCAIAFRKKGFFEKKLADVEIFSNKVTTLDPVSLTAIPGASIVMKVEPATVTAFVDDKPWELKKTDDGRVMLAGLAPGEHTVRFECKDYLSVTQEKVAVTKENATELDPITLKSSEWRPITITVIPREVEVTVNGKKINTSLTQKNEVLTDPVEPGTYKVQISAAGYEGWLNDKQEVFKDISTSIGPIVLAKMTGEKIIINTSEPFPCTIDGKQQIMQQRPDRRYQITNVKPGKHSLTISRELYQDLVFENLEVTKEQPAEIKELLWKEKTGNSIILSTEPGEVKIYVNDELKGTTAATAGESFTIEGVNPGDYAVRAEKEGYTPWKNDKVTVGEKEPLTLPKISLEKAAPK